MGEAVTVTAYYSPSGQRAEAFIRDAAAKEATELGLSEQEAERMIAFAAKAGAVGVNKMFDFAGLSGDIIARQSDGVTRRYAMERSDRVEVRRQEGILRHGDGS